MKKLMIEGGRTLRGTVHISGAKNSSVAIIPATILSNTPVEVNGLPNISDVHTLRELLEDIGGEALLEKDKLSVNPKGMNFKRLIDKKSQKLRASYYFMGAMLGKFKEAYIGLPGGCHLGPRPIDQHIKGFKALGANVNMTPQGIYLSADKLKGADIYLDIASVGATINIMLAAVKAEGQTIIKNAAQEPEIVDVATFLSHMGAQIKGAGTDTIRIEGVDELNGSRHTVIPDRIEAGTYMIMASAIGDEVVLDNIIPEHLEPLILKLREMGVNINVNESKAIITKSENLKSVDVKTLVHPGFPTDLQQPLTALLTQTTGVATVTDTIYSERFKQIYELRKMGANAKVKGNTTTISGPTQLSDANVEASDLRAGAALVIAGLMADGVTAITGIEHIERGYEDIVEKLTNLGASVWRESQIEQKIKKASFSTPILNKISLAESQLLR